ncbi:hypothetical protein [Stakelama saccharophila]|uniref:Response regulatory domain-containing protein n=1 Tax=Stakelama saccharophila TaxID=3075605 RepID=A0ABZ0B8F0_9SPHN|nr:hypothetical protein [Stakelama sp. W311]WNO52871.1 hypothetical protein RPR59_10425 [Stakelama sp. W311]
MIQTEALDGKCALIVEDEYFVADDLRRGLSDAGMTIVGPVPDADAEMV